MTSFKTNLLRGRSVIVVPRNRKVIKILDCLERCGLISCYTVCGETIEFFLKHIDGEPIIRDVKQRSKVSSRAYVSYLDLRKKRKDKILIISTPLGIYCTLENEFFLRHCVGGEILVEIF